MAERRKPRKSKIGKVKKNLKLEKTLNEYKQVRSRQYRLDGLFRELVARKTGMSMSEQACLGYLMEKGKATPTELARIIGLTTGAMTGLIARLEKQRCLTSERDTKDKRKVIVRPVEKVAAMPVLYYRNLTEKYYQLLSSFNEDQLEFLLYKSRAITKMLEDSIRRMIHENDGEKAEARKKGKRKS